MRCLPLRAAALIIASIGISAQSPVPAFKPYEMKYPQLNQKDFVLGPYRIQAPSSFLPLSGQPGDPRRSRFLVLTIPSGALHLPPTVEAKIPRFWVVKLSLEPGDAERLAEYKGVIESTPVLNYDGYQGHHLKTQFELYVAPSGRKPLYVVCPLPLGKYYAALSPMLCNADESVVSAGDHTPDLSMQYMFRDDNWSDLPKVSNALKSIIEQLVVIQNE